MYKLLLLLPFLISTLPAGTIKPRTMEARDHRPYERSVCSSRHRDNMLLSTLEATTEISSILLIEASSQATTQRSYSPNDPYAINFIEENRIEISQDMARAKGEHLTTLLKMLNLQYDETHLMATQSKFETLSSLSSNELLTQLKAMQSPNNLGK